MADKDFGNSLVTNSYYSHTYGNAFNSAEKNQISNVNKLVKLDKKLSKSGDAGWDKFNKLNDDTKSMLYSFYGGDKSYMQEPQSGWGAFWEGAKNTFINVNPITWAWRGIETYSKAINTVYNVGLQNIVNGDNVFDKDTWYNGWNEKDLYDNNIDKELTKRYGKVKSFIAKQSLMGKTPGEIAAAYGTLSPEFLKELESYMNDGNKWSNGVLEDYEQASLSVGRTVARAILGARSGKGDPEDTWFTGISGTVDAAFTVFADPLTYMTFGASTGIRFMGKALNETAKISKEASNVAKIANHAAKTGEGTADVSKIFAFPAVKTKWDDYGSRIEALVKATKDKDPVVAARIREDLRINFPEHGTDEDILLMSQAKIFNADDAEKFFSDFSNIHKLFVGRTSDTTFFRTSVMHARRNRFGTQILRQKWNKLGTGTYTDDELRAMSNDIRDEFTGLGAEIDNAARIETPVLKKLQNEQKKVGQRLINLLSQSAGDEAIIIGEGVEKTLGQVRLLLQVIVGKEAAGVATELFLRSTPAERLVQLRGTYRAIMESVGLDKTPGGQETIERILREKFGAADEGMTVVRDISANGLTKYGSKRTINGAVHNFQTTQAIGHLPWQDVLEAAGNLAFKSAGKSASKDGKISVLHTIGGALNSSLATNMTNTWSLFTLAPKLGIRSSIDEAFMFGLTAPREVLMNFLKGRAAGKALTAFTGSNRAIGPISNTVRKIAKKFGGRFAKDIDLVGAISLEERVAMYKAIVDAAKGKNIPMDAINNAYLDALASRSVAIFDKLAKNPQIRNDIIDAMRTNPHIISSAESGVAKYTGAGKIDDMVRVHTMSMSTLTRTEAELKILTGGDYRLLSPRVLGAEGTRYSMFKNFYMRFVNNKLGGKINLTEEFFQFNGLLTDEAIDMALRSVKGKMAGQEGALLRKKIINNYAGTVASARKGATEEELLDEIIINQLLDMRKAFHGEGFNQQFVDEVLSRVASYPSKMFKSQSDKYDEVIKNLSYEDYTKLVGDNLTKDEIVTDIIKIDDMDLGAGGWYDKFGDGMWDMMDRTATALLRQPAVMSYYLHYRKFFRAFEQGMARKDFDDTVKSIQRSGKDLGGDIERVASGDNFQIKVPTYDAVMKNPELFSDETVRLFNRSSNTAKSYYTEVAMKSAVNNTLKFVDNPHVRTNLVGSIRNVNRFYRAIEDFYRRIYRVKDVSSRAIYRLRLTHSGLNGAGIVEKDEQGNEYLVMPMDNIIFAGLDPVLRTLSGGNLSFKQPLFNKFTFRMTGLNPSFQDDAGLPYLSGPIASVGVMGLKGLVGHFGDDGKAFAEDLDNMLLGDIGDNLDIRKAIVPASLDRIWKMLDTDEKNIANSTATLSAIAYMQANAAPLPIGISKAKREKLLETGMYILPADATPQERLHYIKNIRISGHNLVAIRSLFGLILPASPSTQESVGLPDYIRDSGITSISSEYYDILDTVFTKYGDDISDPYEVAAAIFVGNNPGKLAYTVSREAAGVKKILNSTAETQDWLLRNNNFVEQYGEASYLFAPRTGEHNLGVYNWMKAAGLIETIGDEDFLSRVQVIRDKQTYFDIGEQLEIDLGKTANYQERKTLINNAEYFRSALKSNNPLLETELGSGDFTVTSEEGLLDGVKSILQDKSSPISSDQRKRLKYAMLIFDKAHNYIQNPELSSVGGYTSLKLGMRNRAMDELEKLASTDPFIRQIYSSVFKPILKYYARDSHSAGPTNAEFGNLSTSF
jgi:hypothetical protein